MHKLYMEEALAAVLLNFSCKHVLELSQTFPSHMSTIDLEGG